MYTMNTRYTLKKTGVFHYPDAPLQKEWAEGTEFTLRGAAIIRDMSGKYMIELQDPDGRHIRLHDGMLDAMFDKYEPPPESRMIQLGFGDYDRTLSETLSAPKGETVVSTCNS